MPRLAVEAARAALPGEARATELPPVVHVRLPPSVRIYFATELVDIRNGIDGLRGIVETALEKDVCGTSSTGMTGSLADQRCAGHASDGFA
jgi:hypothetical protein